ncbi:MAG: group 1 glycosyl transferase, partial [Rhodobacterales bacterium 17-64-5]
MDPFFMEQDSGDLVTWLVDFLASFEADIYHFHHVWNIGVSTIRRLRQRMPKAKFVVTLHEFTAICANHGQMLKSKSNQLCNEAGDLACAACLPQHAPLSHRLRRRRMTELVGLFDHVISPSRFLADRFEAWGVAAGRIEVIENGVPFAHRPTRQKRDVAALATRFAYFGQATPTKGLNILIEAAGLIESDLLARRARRSLEA